MNYPNKIKKCNNSFITYGNRGMELEELLNQTNLFYLEKNIALIYKKPTDIGIVKVDYSNKQQIVDAYFKTPSTLDYNGIYKGKYIEFDAKATQNRTSFPLKNIHDHQINHLKKVIEHNGIVFLIIKMNASYFLFPGKTLISFLEKNTRKSIPYDFIKENSYFIKEQIDPPLDYLKGIDQIYFGGE